MAKLQNLRYCSTFVSKLIGLMFHPWTNKLYIFDFKREMRIDLHTLFVFYPLHIYFLDNKKKVIEKTYMKPFRFYYSKKKAMYCVESMNELNFKTGKKLEF